MRKVWIGLIVGAATVAAGWYAAGAYLFAGRPILVGILHSETGPMAISEKSMIDGELLAIEEINERGGLLGRRVQPVIADGRSDWPTYALQARKLIEDDHVNVIFGCWTSASRKSVKPIIEGLNHLLLYPMAYEGLEESPNIIYTGATANQQVVPAVSWCIDTLKAKRFFVVGSDYIWPHSVNALIKDQLTALGVELVGEEYIFFGSTDVDDTVAAIMKARPDVVMSTVVGESNLPFYQRLHAAGVEPTRMPVVSFSIAEDELRKIPAEHAAGHYAAWNYFQSVDRPPNHAFVRRFKARYGEDRVTSPVIEAAYASVQLWAQAVDEAGKVEAVEVRPFLASQSLDAPEGIISVDPTTQHTWHPFYLARMRSDGQFDIVYKIQKPVRPIPYPFGRSVADWDSFLNGLFSGWGNRWANPVKPAK